MKSILISGYYGFGNSGDEALLLSIISELKKEGLGDVITVLSANPAETEEKFGVRAINRINPFSVLFNIIRCHMFISGGGTLIQDGTSTKSLMYYLYLIKTALFFNKKVMLYANGIGPVFKESNIKACKKVLNNVDCITLRDKKSYELLKSWGINTPEIQLTADPVFLLEPKSEEIDILKDINGEYICVSIRDSKKIKSGFESDVSEALDKISLKHNVKVLFLPLQAADKQITERVASRMTVEPLILSDSLSPVEIMQIASKSRMCIGMRLHMLIYAAAVGSPLVGIVYDPKVSGFMEYAEQNLFIDVADVTEDKFYKLADECLTNSDHIRDHLLTVADKLKSLSGHNGELASQIYNRK